MLFWNRFYELCTNNTKPNAVAKELGFSNATCTQWKNGSIPSGDKLMIIADYFNCSIDYLLGRQNVSIKNTITTGDIQGDHNANINSHDSNNEFEKEISSILSGLTVREKTELMTMIYKFSDEHKK